MFNTLTQLDQIMDKLTWGSLPRISEEKCDATQQKKLLGSFNLTVLTLTGHFNKRNGLLGFLMAKKVTITQ